MLDFCIRGQTSLTTPVSTPTVLISCRGTLLSGMFGTFPVAQTHVAVGAAHAQQMKPACSPAGVDYGGRESMPRRVHRWTTATPLS